MPTPTEAAFEALYRAQYDDVLRFVSRRAHPSHVDDIVAETFLTAWRRRDEDLREPRPWLFRTARNIMLNAHRGDRRQRAVAVRIASHPAEVGPDHAGSVETLVDVAGAWHELSPKEQEVLALHIWDGLSDKEAATVAGCHRAAYAMRLTRAKRHLARILHSEAAHPTLALAHGQE
jgi:RNA polymerase sigma factor (sigma-70 family)